MSTEIVLITGTSSGFGFAAAIELAKQGYTVIATMRNMQHKQQLTEKAREFNIEKNLHIIHMDVTNEEHINEVYKYIEATYGKLDILINNAGYSLGGITEYLSMENWQEQFDTNLFAVVSVTKAFLPIMRTRKKGKIINIGSISGRIGFPGLGPYAASKFALEGFSESLRLELSPFNIKVSLIEAGSFKTKIWEKGFERINLTEKNDYTSLMKTLFEKSSVTAENAGNPDEVIRLILKICKSPNPKLRYYVGKGIKTLVFLKGILPWSVLEWFIKKNLKYK